MTKTKYSVPLGRIAEYPHPAPLRTALCSGSGVFSDYIFRVYPSRTAMLTGVANHKDAGVLGAPQWKPLVKESK